MTHTGICGIDAQAYTSADFEQPGVTRVEYHCKRCGRATSLTIGDWPNATVAISAQSRCVCGGNGVVVDDVFVGDQRLARQPVIN